MPQLRVLAMSRHQRILEIHRRLKAQQRLTAKPLAKHFECDERTIRRDLEHLRDDHQMPVEYDQKNYTWFYSKPVTDLPATLVSIEDRRALLVAQQAAELFAGTPWYARLKSAYARLMDALPTETETDFANVARHIRFEGTPIPPVEAAVWETICLSIEASETLRMTYKTGHSGEVKERDVDPYGLVVRNHEWSLIGWDHLRGAVRTFLLSRIQAIEDTDKKFRVKDGFTLDKYLRTAVDGQQSTGPLRRVKLRYTVEGSASGEGAPWTGNDKRSYDNQKRLIVEFETAAMYAVCGRVLASGGKVEVLEPKELRKEVKLAAEKVRLLNSS